MKKNLFLLLSIFLLAGGLFTSSFYHAKKTNSFAKCCSDGCSCGGGNDNDDRNRC